MKTFVVMIVLGIFSSSSLYAKLGSFERSEYVETKEIYTQLANAINSSGIPNCKLKSKILNSNYKIEGILEQLSVSFDQGSMLFSVNQHQFVFPSVTRLTFWNDKSGRISVQEFSSTNNYPASETLDITKPASLLSIELASGRINKIKLYRSSYLTSTSQPGSLGSLENPYTIPKLDAIEFYCQREELTGMF